MPKTITAYLQLIRLPNVVTAAADSLAGWLLATGSLAEPGRWLPLAAASMVLYASGTALNDVFDIEIDRVERPSRPLPSGRVSPRGRPRGSAVSGWCSDRPWLLASGSVARARSWRRPCRLHPGYDAGLKHTWLGPLFMGACRGLNLLLGLSAAQCFRRSDRLAGRARPTVSTSPGSPS